MTIGISSTGNSTADQLKQFADRMERLLEEIDGLKADLKDLRGEAKAAGFNVRALDKLVTIRRKDAGDQEAELLNDLMLYAHATGTPLDIIMPNEENCSLKAGSSGTPETSDGVPPPGWKKKAQRK